MIAAFPASLLSALQKETWSNEGNSDYMKCVPILLKGLLFRKIIQVRGRKIKNSFFSKD